MAFCSNIKIVHGAVTLLDYGDKVDAPPSINGQQLVDVVPLLRAAGVKVFPRGNESNTLEWTLAAKVGSAHTAARNVFRHAADLPRTVATVTVTVNDEDEAEEIYELAQGVVESWGASWGATREARTVRIVGAKFIPVLIP